MSKSFFERLTGSMKVDDNEFEDFEDVQVPTNRRANQQPPTQNQQPKQPSRFSQVNYPQQEEEEEDGQLSVDVYQTPSDIIIKAMVAGVHPDDLDISITREMITIRGRRHEEDRVSEEDFFYQELYWGAFSRTIVLPVEIEVEEAEAVEKNGLLILRLPKIDKDRQTKLKIKKA